MKRYGLIGKKLSHSKSAEWFAEKFAREGIKATYELLEMEDLTELPDLDGFNVTIPYKELIISHLDDLSEEARQIGAVNCVRRFPDEKYKGYNTDAEGFRPTLFRALNYLNNRKLQVSIEALVLGTGGAAKAVGHELRKAGIKHRFISRTVPPTYIELTGEVIANNRLIINTTPVGTQSAEVPCIPYEFFTENHAAIDLVYNPAQTEFLKKAAARKAYTENGADMLRKQAEASWKIWSESLPLHHA